METDQSLFQNVQRALSKALAVPDSVILPSTSMQTLKDWDSLQFLHVVSALETRFGVKFSVAEMQKLTSVSSIMAALSSRGEGGGER
jgi:acyl carrier protein